MIEIICGEKGKGKTKELLEKVNHTVSTVTGSVVYLDKSQKHMYELNNKSPSDQCSGLSNYKL